MNHFFHLDTDNIVFSLIMQSDNQNSTSQAKIAKVNHPQSYKPHRTRKC